MSRCAALLPLMALAACTSSGPPAGAADASLRVSLVEDYYWPQPVVPPGSAVSIDVFPLVTALVVDRPDGPPLGPGDEAASRAAARAYCEARGKRFAPSAPSRHDGGTWAFPPCAAPPR